MESLLAKRKLDEQDEQDGRWEEGFGHSRDSDPNIGVLDILASRAVEESRASGMSDEVVTLQQCKVGENITDAGLLARVVCDARKRERNILGAALLYVNICFYDAQHALHFLPGRVSNIFQGEY